MWRTIPAYAWREGVASSARKPHGQCRLTQSQLQTLHSKDTVGGLPSAYLVYSQKKKERGTMGPESQSSNLFETERYWRILVKRGRELATSETFGPVICTRVQNAQEREMGRDRRWRTEDGHKSKKVGQQWKINCCTGNKYNINIQTVCFTMFCSVQMQANHACHRPRSNSMYDSKLST
jgi:hypothetical protein